LTKNIDDCIRKLNQIKFINWKMKKILKSKLHLVAILVAIITTIAFTVHCDDTKFKSFARSLIKQKVASAGPTYKVKIDPSPCFIGNTSAILNSNIVLSEGNYGNLIQTPTLIFAESIPPYRGPPISTPS